MSYKIRKSDGTLLLELGDGFTDNTVSSLTLIGKNVSQFGETQNNDFLHLLENFSALTEPANKLTGQLWFDKTNSVIKVYNEDKWQPLSVLTYSTSSSASSNIGNLWFNTDSNQLFINNGSGFSLVGPDGAPDFGPTRMVTTVLKDLSNSDHPVIEMVLNNETIGIISATNFDVNSTNGLTGFPYVYKGITFKNGTTTEVQLYGWSKFSDASNTLKNTHGDFVYAATSATSNSIVQRDYSSGIAVNDISAASITSNTTVGEINGSWGVTHELNPIGDLSANLGTSSLRWSDVYARNINSAVLSSTSVKFSNLTDPDLNSITKFDKDPFLSANSHSTLATQRAIKEYIDTAIATEISNRAAADANIQNQVSGFESIPAGIVMYTAGATVPTGFLALTGQTLSKNTYAKLYAAIGGVYGQTDTTFNLPDARGEFIRSWDHGRGVDSGRSLGTTQTADLGSHYHNFTDAYANVGDYGLGPSNMSNYDRNGVYIYPSFYAKDASDGDRDNGMYGFPSKTDLSTGSETRPRNIALQAIIKY